MPIRFEKDAPSTATSVESPFVGPIDHTVGVQVDLSALTDDEIDANGWVMPGIPLTKDGALLGTGDDLFGITVEAIKVAKDNGTATIAALGIQELAVATICQVNQDIAEDNLGRAYTAAELAGFAASRGIVLL